MVFRENFSSSVHPPGTRSKLQDTHHIFSFVPSYPFSDSRDNTSLAPPFPYTYCFYKPYSFPGHLAHQFLLFPFVSLPIGRAPIFPNGSQCTRAQDRVDLLRLHGWPTETEIHVCNWNCLLFSKGHQVLTGTLPHVTLTSLYPPSPPTPFMYGEDSLCFPDAKQEIDHTSSLLHTPKGKKKKKEKQNQRTNWFTVNYK